MGKFVDTRGIIWPFRFDLLVRLDFLSWLESEREEKIANSELREITGASIKESRDFFSEAKAHPYFIQYTKLKRGHRLCNFDFESAEEAYADGLANFIRLHEEIKRGGFETKRRITLKKPMLKLRSWGRGEKNRDTHIGDGCHRLACLLWGKKSFVAPDRFFKLKYKLFIKPEESNLTAGYKVLGILSAQDIAYFDRVFEKDSARTWEMAFRKVREVRDRFSHMDIEGMFDIKFSGLDFRC